MANPYQPVIRADNGELKGAAMTGTHSTIIGWDLNDSADKAGLLGFAIRRSDIDPDTGEVLRLDWLGGYKRFEEINPGNPGDVRSLQAPFQRFRWNDYTLHPNKEYLFEVFPMRGTPTNLVRGDQSLKFHLTPSPEDLDDLGIYVNRGVTAAMAYFRRFENKHPDRAGDKAFEWLSRGLKESLLGFIGQAQPGEALHVAIYEFHDTDVAKAFKEAIDRGVDVHIIHDAKPGKRSTAENEHIIHQFGLEHHRTKRDTVNISHNKFVIHLVGGVAKQVWTGSANFSKNAFYFQTNTALVIRDAETGEAYEKYYQSLLCNPTKAKSKDKNRTLMDEINAAPGFSEKTFFSPIRQKEILETANALIGSTESALMISAPFGVDKHMVAAFQNNSADIVEYGLVNTTARKKIKPFMTRASRFFTPAKLVNYQGRTWDAKAFGAHKIHAKTLVVDPWGDNPQVLIGSANFSRASCVENDENALLISGNKRLAAVIATEFMRMYDHYKARFYIATLPQIDIFLEDDDSWSDTAFNSNSNSHKFRDRIVFSGQK